MSKQTGIKERPILFKAEMVNAILAGRKTQTRRILKGSTEHKGPYNPTYIEQYKNSSGWKRICPKGKLGDSLYVKERINYNAEHDNFYYAADKKGCGLVTYNRLEKKTCPSILMPKICHRIMLEITDIRVERLNNITEEDAKAEGIYWFGDTYADYSHQGGFFAHKNPVGSFKSLWESINGPESFDDKWVWVIEFKMIENATGT